jgi:hypothetical protein
MREIRSDNPVGGGGVCKEEGLVLAALAHVLGGPILEVGTAMGRSTRFLYQATEEEIVSVDIGVDDNLELDAGAENVYLQIRDSATLGQKGEELIGHFRWAFVDGYHELAGVRKDLEMLKRLQIPLAVFHDASGEYWPGVKQALKERECDWKMLYLPTSCGLVIAVRNQ